MNLRTSDYVAVGGGVVAALSLTILFVFPTLPAIPPELIVFFVAIVPLTTGILVGYMETTPDRLSARNPGQFLNERGLRATAIVSVPVGICAGYLLFFVVGYAGAPTIIDPLLPLAVILTVALGSTTIGSLLGRFLALR